MFDKQKTKNLIRGSLFAMGLSIVAPFIAYFLFMNYVYADSKFQYLGTIFSGLLGGSITLLVLVLTFAQSQEQFSESIKKQDESIKIAQDSLKQATSQFSIDKRLSVIPYIDLKTLYDVSSDAGCELKLHFTSDAIKQNTNVTHELRNLGNGNCLNLRITTAEINGYILNPSRISLKINGNEKVNEKGFNLKIDESIKITLNTAFKESFYDVIKMVIRFEDIIGNQYEQNILLTPNEDLNMVVKDVGRPKILNKDSKI